MAKNIHKGRELNNVNETWENNERVRQAGHAPEKIDTTAPTAAGLDQVIREEAAAYDASDKDERLLPGDRATLNDDDTGRGSDE